MLRRLGRTFTTGHVSSLQGHVSWTAPYSTDGATEIKSRLRELYKRVHPDLFHSLPKAQKANEKSFKLLQEYLSFGKDGGPFGNSAGVPYRFEFFLHNKRAHPAEEQAIPQGDQNEGNAANSDEDVKKVSVTLPPPGRLNNNSSDSKDMPEDLQRAMAKLLAACGLKTFVKELDEPTSYVFGEMSPNFTFTRDKLSEFMVQAAELVRQNESRQFGPLQQLGAARTALRFGRQVSAEFVGSLRKADPATKARLMQQLAQALDRSPEDVTGLTFLIGDAYGSDSRGRVRLDYRDDATVWSGYMWQIDLDSCRTSQQVVAALKRLESSVAKNLGVGLVFSSPHLALEDRYRQCLERLASHASINGPMFQRPAVEIALRIEDSETIIPKDTAGKYAWDVDYDGGALMVGVDAEASRIYNFCQEHAHSLVRHLENQKEESAQLEHLRHNTERRLLLRKLTFDPSVSRPRIKSACQRLCQGAEKLRGLMDGLSVRISHVNQVSREHNDIDVAWNFQV